MGDQGELTAADVGKIFHVNETTVYKWEREGLLPKRVGSGRHAKWRKADIDRVREARTIKRDVY